MHTATHFASETPLAGALSAARGEVIKRTMSADALNTVANDPCVRPWLGGEGEMDLAPVVSDPRNFAFETACGGFLALNREPGIYEVHSLFVPGGDAFTAAAVALEYMFTRTDAFRLVTQLPDDNLAAKGLARKFGFRRWFRSEDTPQGASWFAMLELDEWVQATAELENDGEWFHDQLLAAKAANDSARPVHAHHPAHERAVGAAVRMIRAGNARKGVTTYNRWASAAGYAPLAIVSETPLVIDVVDALVAVNSGKMEVLECR